MSLPRPLRSLRNRLALIFAAIVAGAIGFVYLFVVPTLEAQLRRPEARDAGRATPALSVRRLAAIAAPTASRDVLDRGARQAADRSSAEVTAARVRSGEPADDLPAGRRLHAEAA